MKQVDHVGLHSGRLLPNRNNTRERVFADQWRLENSQYDTLRKLLPGYSQRDATVAATIVQWLGSNCGLAFLTNTMERSTELRGWLKRYCSVREQMKSEELAADTLEQVIRDRNA